MTKTDIIIIGSGPGGYRAAEYAAKNGLQVTIIEENYIGGTCLNCGCIPTKTYCKNAEVIDSLDDAEIYGLKNITFNLDFSQILKRKNEIVHQLRSGIEILMSMPGINLVHGKAKFKDSKTVIVNNIEYTAENIIISTGSVPKSLPIEGIDLPGVLNSTQLLNIKHLPENLCIIGAGVIGMEFACAFNSFGSKVTIIEFLKECLPTLDSDIAKRLRKTVERKGIEFHLQSGVKKIESKNGRLLITFERKNKEMTVEADNVLVATGRNPNFEGLNLKSTNIRYTTKGIIVDEDFKTNIPGTYAIGDVNGKQMLAHAATFQGLHAVNCILGKSDNIRFDVMPSAIFTNPEASSVGLTEQQCKANSIEYKAYKGYYRTNGKALAMNASEGMVKLISDMNGKIIGCHIYGAHAADLIQEVASLINRNTTFCQLADIIHIHPTLGEILQEIALQA